MASNTFMKVDEAAEMLGISKSYAYHTLRIAHPCVALSHTAASVHKKFTVFLNTVLRCVAFLSRLGTLLIAVPLPFYYTVSVKDNQH